MPAPKKKRSTGKILLLVGLLLFGGCGVLVAATASQKTNKTGTSTAGATTTIANPASPSTAPVATAAAGATNAPVTTAGSTKAGGSIPLGQTHDSGTFKWTVHGTRKLAKATIPPKAGNVYVLVDVEVTNVTKSSETLSVLSAGAFDGDNYSYNPDLFDAGKANPLGDILPGQTRRGEITFEVPSSAVLATLLLKDSPFDQTPQAFALK